MCGPSTSNQPPINKEPLRSRDQHVRPIRALTTSLYGRDEPALRVFYSNFRRNGSAGRRREYIAELYYNLASSITITPSHTQRLSELSKPRPERNIGS